MRRPLTGVIFCEAKVRFPPTDRPTLRLPIWLQHFHAPRVPLKELGGLTIKIGENTLEWRRDPGDVYRFDIECRHPIDELDIAWQMLTPTDSVQDRIVVGAAMARVQWSSLVLYPDGFLPEEISVRATVLLPDGWTADGSLPVAESTDGAVSFQSVDLRRLVDSPLLCGLHCIRAEFAEGVRAAIFADRDDQLPHDEAQIAAHSRMVPEVDALFGGRPFDEYVFLLSLSDNLGTIGLEHRHSSENGVLGDYFTDWENSITERDLLPHEYIHAWCGKYRTPAGTLQRDFTHPLTNELMWVYEGFTQYYGHVIAARCGLISPEATIEAFAEIAQTYDCRAGRDWRPLDDTNHDPIINGRGSIAWTSWQRSEDYYSEGALVWMEADMLIRNESGGERSLDDFARVFFRPDHPGGPPKPYAFGDLVAALATVWSHDWATYLTDRTQKIATRAPTKAFALGGYELTWQPKAMRWSVCDQKHHSYCDFLFSIGMKVGLNSKIIDVAWDGAAHDAQLAVGATILSLNDGDYSDDAMRAALAATASGGPPINLRVLQAGIEREVTLDWREGNRHPGVQRIDEAADYFGQALLPRAGTT